MKWPLKSVLLSIFQAVTFPALFCSSLTRWLFQGEIAISTSRCTSMIAVTPIPSVHPQKNAFCILTYHLLSLNRSNNASSFTYPQVCPSTTGIWLFFCWEIQLLRERLVLFFPDILFHCTSFTDTLFLRTTPQFSLKIPFGFRLAIKFTRCFINVAMDSHKSTNSKLQSKAKKNYVRTGQSNLYYYK